MDAQRNADTHKYRNKHIYRDIHGHCNVNLFRHPDKHNYSNRHADIHCHANKHNVRPAACFGSYFPV